MAGNAEIDTFRWYGTLASFGFIVIYLLCSDAAPVYLRKTGELTAKTAVLGATGAVLMALSLAGSLYPTAAYPANVLPYVFSAYMSLGAVWFAWLRARASEALLGIEHDLEIADVPPGAKVL